MRSRMLVAVALAVGLATGCATGADHPTTGRSEPSQPPRWSLAAAIAELAATSPGEFFLSAGVAGGKQFRELGDYDPDTGAYQYERIRPTDVEGVFDRYEIRQLEPGVVLGHDSSRGTRPTCWVRLDPTDLVNEFGDHLPMGTPVLNYPPPVAALLAAETDGAARTGNTVRTRLDAFIALSILGLPGGRLAGRADDLEDLSVPFTITLQDDRIVSATLDGKAAAQAVGDFDGQVLFDAELSELETFISVNPMTGGMTVRTPAPGTISDAGEGADDCRTRPVV